MANKVPAFSIDRMRREQARQSDDIASLRDQAQQISGKVAGSVDAAYVDDKIAALVNAAPGALDTLKELADALGDDANFAATVTTALAGKEPTIAAGTTAQYRRGDKTWQDFATDVRAAILTGLSTASAAVVAATDTVLVAIGKLQAQVSANVTAIAGKVGTARAISTSAPLTGGGDLSADRALAISAATTSAAGSMSAADKAKLDAVPTLSHGTYTPTLTGVVNVDAATCVTPLQWLRVGNTVTVSGRLDIDPTLAANTLTRLGVSLPVASNIGAAANLAGTGAIAQTTFIPSAILGDVTNDRAEVQFYSNGTVSAAYLFSFTYVVI